MEWVKYSILAAFSQSFNMIGIKYASKEYNMTDFNILTFISATLFYIMYMFMNKEVFTFNYNSGISGIAAALAYLTISIAIEKASNPGLPTAVYRIQMILTALFAFFFMKYSLSFYKIILFPLLIYGTYLIAKQPKPENSTQLTQGNQQWVKYALIAAVFSSILDITTARSLKYINPISHGLILSVTCVVTLLLVFLVQKYNIFQIEEYQDKQQQTKFHYLIPIVCGAFYFLLFLFLSLGIKYAPNPGYVKAIIAFSIVIVTVISSLIFENSQISSQAWAGIILVTLASLGIGYF
jgi:uncharacterized membrane protein